jgi:hypothetical protein
MLMLAYRSEGVQKAKNSVVKQTSWCMDNARGHFEWQIE